MGKPRTGSTRADDEIIGALTEFLDVIKKGGPARQQLRIRTYDRLKLLPEEYKAEDIKKTRELLDIDQGMFAQLLGVSVKTVRGWEQGRNSPAPIARRFMDEINATPDHWKERLRKYMRAAIK